MAIEKLVDSQNFGEWKETINDVIDSVNGYDGINEAVKESIDGALSAGQIGEYLSISSLKDYDKYTLEQAHEMGINDSMIHVDFMIGTPDLSIVGKTADGREVKIFENGNWAF